ncbi:DNA invertase Pin-like site-specific DNA recombinase [Arthrobacter sp. UYEF3]
MVNLILPVTGAFAEFERALIGERQREGITLAKAAAPTADAGKRSCPRRRPSCGCGGA